MRSEIYQKLAGNTDLEDYSNVQKRVVKYQKEAIDLFKEMLLIGIKGDMLKKVIIYGLDPESEDYSVKLKKHMDAIHKIETGELSEEVLSSEKFAKLFHYYLGINTESAEMIQVLLNWVLGVERIDNVGLAEENSDCCWYLARANEVLQTSFESIMETNIRKLAARYPNKFTSESALNRNLDAERAILEAGLTRNTKDKKV